MDKRPIALYVLAAVCGFFLVVIGGLTFFNALSPDISFMYGSTELGWRYRSRSVYVVASALEVLFGAALLIVTVVQANKQKNRSAAWFVAFVILAVLYIAFALYGASRQ